MSCPSCQSPQDPCEILRAKSVEPRTTVVTVREGASALLVVQVWACGTSCVSRVANDGSGPDKVTDVYTNLAQVAVPVPDEPELPF